MAHNFTQRYTNKAIERKLVKDSDINMHLSVKAPTHIVVAIAQYFCKIACDIIMFLNLILYMYVLETLDTC